MSVHYENKTYMIIPWNLKYLPISLNENIMIGNYGIFEKDSIINLNNNKCDIEQLK